MNDVILEAIEKAKKLGKKPEVIVRYLRLKWHINVDLQALKRRW